MLSSPVPSKHKDLLKNLRDRVFTEVTIGRTDPRLVEKAIRKPLRRAKRQLNAPLVMELRLVLGELFYWSHKRGLAEKQYRAVLRGQSDSMEAMLGMASLHASAEEAAEWLDRALATCRRLGDHQGELDALDQMIWQIPSRATEALADMCRALADAPEVACYRLVGADSFLDSGRGREVVTYLETALRHALNRDSGLMYYGYYRVVMTSLAPAYSQSGLTARAARAKVRQFRELCRDQESRYYFDRAVRKVFDGDQYLIPEGNRALARWYSYRPGSEEPGENTNVNRR